MSVLLFAFALAASAAGETPGSEPAATEQAQSQKKAKEAKAEPKKFCEYKVVTGSRGKKKVCRDENGNLDVGPGVRVQAVNLEEKTVVIPNEAPAKDDDRH